MFDFGIIGSTLSGIAGMATAWKNNQLAEEQADYNKMNADRNFALQMENFNWQKEMQQEAWNREDNAVQRRVADLKAAGLSPVLAAGSAASSSSPIKIDAPQHDNINLGQRQSLIGAALNAASGFEGLMQQKANVSRTIAEEKLLGERIKSEELNNSILAQTAQSQINLQNLKYEAANLLHQENVSDHQKLNELGFLFGAKSSDVTAFVNAIGGTKKALEWFDNHLKSGDIGSVMSGALTTATGAIEQKVNDVRQQANQQLQAGLDTITEGLKSAGKKIFGNGDKTLFYKDEKGFHLGNRKNKRREGAGRSF